MSNLYDFIGARPGASQEDIHKCIENTRTRLKMTGQIYQGTNEQRLQEAEGTLLNPLTRMEYDKKMGIQRHARPPRPGLRTRLAPKDKRLQQLLLLAGLLAVLVVCLLILFRNSLRSWPTGIYLTRRGSSESVAVLVGTTPTYTFPDKSVGTAWAVKDLQTGQVRWVSRSQLFAEFSAGGPAPESEWQNVKLPPAEFRPPGK